MNIICPVCNSQCEKLASFYETTRNYCNRMSCVFCIITKDNLIIGYYIQFIINSIIYKLAASQIKRNGMPHATSTSLDHKSNIYFDYKNIIIINKCILPKDIKSLQSYKDIVSRLLKLKLLS